MSVEKGVHILHPGTMYMTITNAKKKSKVIPILNKRTSAGVRGEEVLLFSPALI